MLDVRASDASSGQEERESRPIDGGTESQSAAVDSEDRLRHGIQTEGGLAAIEEFLKRPLTIPISS